MHPITDFLSDRKAAWEKAKISEPLSEEEKDRLRQEAADRFALQNWLPDAAKRASQLSMVSHPAKFSHPSAKTSNVIALSEAKSDGYLRTGNLAYELDVFGNAAALDVYKFLMLTLEDGRTLLAHLEEESAELKTFLEAQVDYEAVKQGLLSIKADTVQKPTTDRLVKQVYFPIEDASYHLLSLLSPSGLITRLKKEIDAMRFSDETKEAKEARKKKEFHASGFDDVLDLTVTGYGGTQPQNVSILNSQNAGRAYLLPSAPPPLTRRDVRLPKTNFFKSSLPLWKFREFFEDLHGLMQRDINNRHIRDRIDTLIRFILDRVLEEAFQIRAYGEGWSSSEYYQSLPMPQRIWLDDAFLQEREGADEWMENILNKCAKWFWDGYEKTLKTKAIKVSAEEARHIQNFFEDILKTDEVFFK